MGRRGAVLETILEDMGRSIADMVHLRNTKSSPCDRTMRRAEDEWAGVPRDGRDEAWKHTGLPLRERRATSWEGAMWGQLSAEAGTAETEAHPNQQQRGTSDSCPGRQNLASGSAQGSPGMTVRESGQRLRQHRTRSWDGMLTRVIAQGHGLEQEQEHGHKKE